MFARIKPLLVSATQERPAKYATQLRVVEVSIRGLGEMARVVVTWALVSDDGEHVEVGSSVMPRETYEAWGDDDSFVLEWLAVRLNVRIREVVVQYDDDSQTYPLPVADEQADTDPGVVICDDEPATRTP